MHATEEELSALLVMQQIDLELMQAKKRLDTLPQRQAILDAREKRKTVEQKRGQVEALRAEAEKKVSLIMDEDERLSIKAAAIQDEMSNAAGGYRDVESRSKELAGIGKRRAALDAQLGEASAQLDKVNAVARQVQAALDAVIAEETAQIESFKDEGGRLQNDIARLTARRNEASLALSDDVAKAYTTTSARCAGVAVGRLAGDACGVCRSTIGAQRLIDIRAQAPLATCPSCKRLLIVG